HITDEMLADAPDIADVIPKFHRFIEGAYLVAHHAPFDMGFLAVEFEKLTLQLPNNPVFCSSLLSRRLVPESANHRLQTLISHLGLTVGQAHRALDDSKACLEFALNCFRRSGEHCSLQDLLQH